MSAGEGKAKRPYRMRARAKAAEATRLRILDAVEVAFEEIPFGEITLTAIAERTGVSVQTVLRHFENKDALFMASLLHGGAEMAGDRDVRPVGDLDEIVGVLADHYERFGSRILRMLAQEEREPILHQLAEVGRIYHLEWCKQAFSPALKGLRGGKRKRRIAQFVAATDVYTCKLLRRDRGLSPEQTKLAMRELLEPLMEESR